ncbi:hypothetical protein IW261DRAFT_1346231, partial [Armillaria novae-zelandiae]
MLHVAKDLGVRVDMQVPAQQVQRQIPVWYHFRFRGKIKFHYNSKVFKCLMTNHRVETAGEAELAAARITKGTHKTRRDCKCHDCRVDRTQRNCENPHKCALAAKSVLDFLVDKWDPRRPDNPEDKGLTEEEKIQNLAAREDNGVIRFDPRLDNEDKLTDGVRIFTAGWDTSTRPATRQPKDNNEEIEISIAYTDGSTYENGTAEARAGTGVWFGDGDNRNIFVRLPGPHQTNNAAEIRAI